MFRITDHLTAPMRAHFQGALRNLPEAHQNAQFEGITHLHQKISEAGTAAGLDTSSLGVHWHNGRAQVAIAGGPEGDALAAWEFGTLTEPPNATLRSAARRHHPQAQKVYETALWKGLGF